MAKRPPPPIYMLRGHEGSVSALHFTNEENDIILKPSLISGSDIGEIFIWNLKTLRTYHRFKGHGGKMILYLCFYKSSLVSQGRDGIVNVWKYENNQWIPTEVFHCIIFGFCAAEVLLTQTCNYLAAPTRDGCTLALHDFDKHNILYNFQLSTLSGERSSTSRATCLCIKVCLCDSKLSLLAGFDDGYIALWDSESKTQKSRFKCHAEVVFCLDYDSNYKNRGISGSSDDVLQVWEIRDDQLSKVYSFSISNPGVSAVKIRYDGKIVITSGQDGAIRVFSWKNLKPLAVLQFHTLEVCSLEFCMDRFCKHESVFASGSKDKNICLWSIY